MFAKPELNEEREVEVEVVSFPKDVPWKLTENLVVQMEGENHSHI